MEQRSVKRKRLPVVKYPPEDQWQKAWDKPDTAVYTLFAYEENILVDNESFYLSVYATPEDRDAEAWVWMAKRKNSGYQVQRVNGWGEIDRI